MPFLGLIITIVSLIICIIAKKKVKQTGNASGLVTAGLVLTIIGLIATIMKGEDYGNNRSIFCNISMDRLWIFV